MFVFFDIWVEKTSEEKAMLMKRKWRPIFYGKLHYFNIFLWKNCPASLETEPDNAAQIQIGLGIQFHPAIRYLKFHHKIFKKP